MALPPVSINLADDENYSSMPSGSLKALPSPEPFHDSPADPPSEPDRAVESASNPELAGPDDSVALYEPTGAPEEFGLPYQTAPLEKVRVWDRQEAFLAAYRVCGKIGKSAEAVGLTRWAHDGWLQSDVFGFRDRIKAAHADYCENKIEAMIAERLETPQGNRGSDILLMFKAKAEMPEKYREEVKVIDSGASKDLLRELRRLGRPWVVEGEVVPKEPQKPDAA
jgi:hypothetical protein